MNSHLLKAIGIILFGMVAFDIMGVLIRILGNSYPILQVSVLRNLLGIIPAFILLMIGPGIAVLKKLNKLSYWKIIFIRSTSVLLAQISYYTAITKIEFATASTLTFTSPFFITLLSIPLLGHKVGMLRTAAIFVGFSGVLLIFKPFNEEITIWMILPVFAAFGYGLSSVLVRLIPNEITSAAIQISQQLVTFFLGLILLLAIGDYKPISSPNDLGLFVLMGVFGGVGVLSLVIAYRLAIPSSIAPFEYFGIPISFIFGWLFFKEAPFDTLFPGVFLIIFAGIMVIIRERKIR